MKETFYSRKGKRAFDTSVAALGLVLLLPVMLVVGGVVRARLGAPVLFRQVRPGLDGRPFTLLKFRTMSDRTDESGNLLCDSQRLTSVGRFLRRTSLDELPELWNVLRGDMSLVGPRPLLMEYLDRYSPEQHRRHAVRPGITGLAQVAGRNGLSWDEKFRLDIEYVDSASLPRDLKILAMTFGAVITGHGVSQPGVATAEKFRGTSKP